MSHDRPQASAPAMLHLEDPSQVAALLGIPFTPDQLEAIGAPPQPLVIVAGAGSGKTAVMAARVVWLVGSGHVAPDQVLGLTFTNKAAGELGVRIRTALHQLIPLGPGRLQGDAAAGEPTVSTYHAYAARLLSEQGLRLGIEPDARLLTESLRFQLAQRVLRRAPGPYPAFEQGLNHLTGLLLALDAELCEHLVTTDDVRAHDNALIAHLTSLPKVTKSGASAQATARARLDLLDLVDALQREKRRLSVIDFGDQLALAARLVREHPDVGSAERDRFRVVLLDEYQDTSVAQKNLLLDVFGHGHAVTAVGDPFQAIYGWRGASVRNIRTFAQEFCAADGTPATTLGLSQNNRSGERVLDAANAIAEPLRAVHAGVAPLVPRADHVGTGRVDVGVFLTADDEVEWGANFVRDSVESGRSPRDHAVLFRTTAGIAAWHHALTVRGVPVEVVGLGGLLELPEIVDLVSTLQVLDDPTANPAMVRLLAGPRWRLGPADLMALGHRAASLVRGRHGPGSPGVAAPTGATAEAGASGEFDPDAHLMAALADAVGQTDETDIVSLLDAVVDPADAALSVQGRARVAACAHWFERLRPLVALPLPDLVAAVIGRTGLDVEVAVRDGAQRRSEALGTFSQLAADFADLDGEVTLRAFLAYLSVAADHDRRIGGRAPSGADSVTLMTVHASKGLEFPIVVLPDVTNTVFPSSKARSTWVSDPGSLPSALRGDADDFPPPVQDWSGEKGVNAYKAAIKEQAEIEERRLAYVAITRAQEHVVATSHWWGRTQKRPRGPSPYLLTLKAVAEAGAGTLVHWQPTPAESDNPFLDADDPWIWPVPIDAHAHQRRVDVAADVRRALADGGSTSGADAHGLDAALDAGDAERAATWARDARVLAEELIAAHRPVTQIAMPTSLTASAVVEIGRDADGFARRLRRPMPRPPAPAATRGTRFHAWVEQRFGQRPLLDRDDLLGAADDDRVLDDEQLRALQVAFEAGPFANRVPLHIEAPFQIVLAGRAIRGRIDAVYATDDGFDVIDWKTGTMPADPVQLAIYRLAWAAIAGVPDDAVTAGFYVVPQGRVDRPVLPTREALIAVLSPSTVDEAR